MAHNPPTTQKADAKPISFLLDSGDASLGGNYVTLYIRPEDMSISMPSRTSTHQTMGQIWVDSYGMGVMRLTISGTTGWHTDGSLFGDGSGLDRFQRLYKTVYQNYHESRAAKVKAGLDPSLVKVILIDKLNDICSSVVPVTFTLKRSKSRPLLLQYNIVFDVVEWQADRAYIIMLDVLKSMGTLGELGIGSLEASLNSITNVSKELSLSSGLSCATELIKFSATTVGVIGSIGNIYKNEGAISAIASACGIGLSSYGMNTCQTLANALGVSPETMGTVAKLMKMGSSFGNIYCLFKNIFKNGIKGFDFSSIQGSSFCASTWGDVSLSEFVKNGTSVFDSIFGTNITNGSISISSDAAKTIDANGIGSTGITTVNNGAVTKAIANVTSATSASSVIQYAGETLGTVNNGVFVPDSLIQNAAKSNVKNVTIVGA